MAENNNRTSADSSSSSSSKSSAKSGLGASSASSLSSGMSEVLTSVAARAVGAPTRSDSKAARKEQEAEERESQYHQAVEEAALQAASQANTSAAAVSEGQGVAFRAIETAPSETAAKSTAGEAFASAGSSQSIGSAHPDSGARTIPSEHSMLREASPGASGRSVSQAEASARSSSQSETSGSAAREQAAQSLGQERSSAVERSEGVDRVSSQSAQESMDRVVQQSSAQASLSETSGSTAREQAAQSLGQNRTSPVEHSEGVDRISTQSGRESTDSAARFFEDVKGEGLSVPQRELLDAAQQLTDAHQSLAQATQVHAMVQEVVQGSATGEQVAQELQSMAAQPQNAEVSVALREVAQALQSSEGLDLPAAQELAVQLVDSSAQQVQLAENQFLDAQSTAREAMNGEHVAAEQQQEVGLRDFLAARMGQEQAAESLANSGAALQLTDEVLGAQGAALLTPELRQEYADALREHAQSASVEQAATMEGMARSVETGDFASLQVQRDSLSDAHSQAASAFEQNSADLTAAHAQLSLESQSQLALQDSLASLASDSSLPPAVNLEAMQALSKEVSDAQLPEQRLQALESLRDAGNAMASAAQEAPESPEASARAALAEACSVDAPSTQSLQQTLAATHYLEQLDSSAMSDTQRQGYAQHVDALAEQMQAAHPDGAARDVASSLKDLSGALTQGEPADIAEASRTAAQSADELAHGIAHEAHAQLSPRLAELESLPAFNPDTASLKEQDHAGAQEPSAARDHADQDVSHDASPDLLAQADRPGFGSQASESAGPLANSLREEEAQRSTEAQAEQELEAGE